jgi:heme/copper-type cytochrome/quinol oxidase subunit 3
MALAVFVEVMLFAGFISAFVIVRGGTPAGLWPPPNQPRLPVAATAVNTSMLLASGVLLLLAHRAFARRGAAPAARLMGAAILLGGLFVLLQGVEWVRLIGQGLTLTSSQLGAFFYVIVGAHALHAMAAIVALVLSWRALRAERLSRSAFGAVQLFWYFVVLMWPVIYWQVYS